MKILIFTEGTIIMHSEGAGLPREEIVQQNVERIPNIKEYSKYVPVGNAPAKVIEWQNNGYEICYLTSRRLPGEVAAIQSVLDKYNFPKGPLFYRKEGESYGDAAMRIIPDVIVEDDCESIGADEITYSQLPANIQQKIKSVIVPEFGGISHLKSDFNIT